MIIRTAEPIDSYEKDVARLRYFYEQGHALAKERMEEIKGLFSVAHCE